MGHGDDLRQNLIQKPYCISSYPGVATGDANDNDSSRVPRSDRCPVEAASAQQGGSNARLSVAWRSSSALSTAPIKTAIQDTQAQIMNPSTAPAEP